MGDGEQQHQWVQTTEKKKKSPMKTKNRKKKNKGEKTRAAGTAFAGADELPEILSIENALASTHRTAAAVSTVDSVRGVDGGGVGEGGVGGRGSECDMFGKPIDSSDVFAMATAGKTWEWPGRREGGVDEGKTGRGSPTPTDFADFCEQMAMEIEQGLKNRPPAEDEETPVKNDEAKLKAKADPNDPPPPLASDSDESIGAQSEVVPPTASALEPAVKHSRQKGGSRDIVEAGGENGERGAGAGNVGKGKVNGKSAETVGATVANGKEGKEKGNAGRNARGIDARSVVDAATGRGLAGTAVTVVAQTGATATAAASDSGGGAGAKKKAAGGNGVGKDGGRKGQEIKTTGVRGKGPSAVPVTAKAKSIGSGRSDDKNPKDGAKLDYSEIEAWVESVHLHREKASQATIKRYFKARIDPGTMHACCAVGVIRNSEYCDEFACASDTSSFVENSSILFLSTFVVTVNRRRNFRFLDSSWRYLSWEKGEIEGF